MKNDINIKYNKHNEIVKYQFFKELKYKGINNQKPRDQKTISQYVIVIHEFEIAINFKDFKKFTQDTAITFKNYLNAKKNIKTGLSISKSFYIHTLKYVREFFEWLIINAGKIVEEKMQEPAEKQDIPVVEMDELYTFIKKNEIKCKYGLLSVGTKAVLLRLRSGQSFLKQTEKYCSK